jgi:hypothetical protein
MTMEIPTPVLVILVVMAALCFLQTLRRFWRASRPPLEDPLTEVPSRLAPPGDAPAGYKWILVPDDD